MVQVDLGKTPKEQESFIMLSMVGLSFGILAADIFIPLGFLIWILYLIPLLMSVWLSYRYAPFVTTWLIAFCILGGGMLSGSVQQPSDLPNRAIFILMTAIVSLLVWEVRTNYADLEREMNERLVVQNELKILTRSLETRVVERTRELSDLTTVLQDDIAERKKVEAALAMVNQKLSLLNQITRHDISNRVFAMLATIDLAVDRTEDDGCKETLERLDQVCRSIQNQIAFTKDYQEIGAKAPSWHRVAPIIARAAGQLDVSGIEIENLFGDTEIFADAMIHKVFYNLIDNALTHGEHVTKIRFSAEKTPEGLLLVCEDNGVGIPTQDKTQIFEREFGRDSGLGLFLVREILSITGIDIRETGDYSRGARFEMLVREGSWRQPEEKK